MKLHTISAQATVFLLLLSTLDAPAFPNSKIHVVVYQPAFLSTQDPALGQNIGSVINTSIWRTFRRTPGQPKATIWGDATASVADQAIRKGKDRNAQIVVWGDAFKYGEGGIANAHFNLLPPKPGEEETQRWTISLPIFGQTYSVSTEAFPERSLYFQPLEFDGLLLHQYASAQLDNIYEDVRGKNLIGRVTTQVLASEFADSYTKVSITNPNDPNGPPIVGYMLLPPPVQGTSALTNFSGASVAILRQRWEWAETLLEKVEADKGTPTNILIDSMVMRAMCLTKLGMRANEVIDSALQLNPTAHRALVAKVMVKLATIQRKLNGAGPMKISMDEIGEIERDTTAAGIELTPDDAWKTEVQSILHAMRAVKSADPGRPPP